VVITGEMGSGKTRLLEDGEQIARSHGATVAWGRSDPGGFAPPLWPWIQILRELGIQRPGTSIEADSETRGLIARLMDESGTAEPAAGTNEGDLGRFRLFDATDRHLGRVARAAPLVLILDDLQNADVMSLGMLEFIAARARTEPLLLLVAASDSDSAASGALPRTVAELMRVPAAKRIELRSLDNAQVGELLTSVLGRTPDTDLVGRVAAETGGNPLFAIELARLIDGSGEASGRTVQRIPAGIREVVLQRCHGLPAETLRLIEYAAVLGKEFQLVTLQRVGELADSPQLLLDLLEPAELIGIVEEAPATPGSYRFSQSLVRDVLYEGITSTRRARMHLAVAAALEAGRVRVRFDEMTRIANHYMQGIAAGSAERAAEMATRAGDEAFAVFAYDLAVHHYSDALMAGEMAGTSEAQRAALLLSLGESKTRSGDVRGGKVSFREAADIARTLNDAEVLSRAALGYGELVEAGVRDPLRVRLIEEALAMLANEDSALRARLLGLLGEALARSGSRQRRMDVTQAAVEMARRLDDDATLAFTLNTRMWALWETPEFDERRSAAEEMLRLALAVDDGPLALKARRWRIVNALELGDQSAIDAEFASFERTARQLRDSVQLWRSATMRIGLEVARANWSAADEAMQLAIARGESVQSRGLARFFGMQRFMIARSRGELASVEEELEAAVARMAGFADLRVLLAASCIASGKVDDARAHYEGVWNEVVSRPVERMGLAGACVLAELCVGLRDTGRAAMIESNLAPHAARNAIFGDSALILGPATRFLGLLAAQQGRLGEALAHLGNALGRARRLRAPYLIAELLVDLASVNDQAGRGIDVTGPLTDEACELATSYGLRGITERVEALRSSPNDRTAASRPRLKVLPAGLTAREAEVLALLARGLTNSETADELVLSVRTVERHIANIYGKIDAHTRAEATAFAIRQNLL